VVTTLVIAFGAVTYPMYALAVAHANDNATGDDFVIIAGGLLLLYGFGTMVGPIAAAFAMERFAPEGLFAFTAAVDAAIIGYTFYRMQQRAPRPTREPFQAMPLPRNVTPESAVLDPRSEPPPAAVAGTIDADA
jgi:hypothetical protein